MNVTHRLLSQIPNIIGESTLLMFSALQEFHLFHLEVNELYVTTSQQFFHCRCIRGNDNERSGVGVRHHSGVPYLESASRHGRKRWRSSGSTKTTKPQRVTQKNSRSLVSSMRKSGPLTALEHPGDSYVINRLQRRKTDVCSWASRPTVITLPLKTTPNLILANMGCRNLKSEFISNVPLKVLGA